MKHKRYEKIGEDQYFGQLRNGLNVNVVTKPGFRLSYAVFATNYGGAHRRFSLGGHSHLLGECDGWESVHGSLHLISRNIPHFPQGFGDQLGSLFQRFEEPIVFLQIEGLGFLADSLEGRIAHQVDHGLPNRVRAKVDGFELNELLVDVGVEIVQIEIASSEAAFSKQALGD